MPAHEDLRAASGGTAAVNAMSSDLGTIAIAALAHLCALWERPRQASTSALGPTPERQQVGALDGQLSLQHLHHIALVGNRQDEQPMTRGTHGSLR